MKALSTIAALASFALIALTLVPAAGDYRAYFGVAALVVAAIVVVTIAVGWRDKPQALVVGPDNRAAAAAPIAPIKAQQAESEVVSFLATLQEKGRFVDFLMDDIAAYSDAQVGAAARVVHDGCKAVIQEHFRIVPVRQENEGSKVTVTAGYSADEYRLVGKISGPAPFSGTLMHRGWKTESVRLPRVLRSDDGRLPTLAPAEVELK